MKTRSVIRNAITYASYILVFLWASLTANAQCPTVTNSNPVICDASNFTFADLNAFADDSVSGNGIIWYDSATGGSSYSSTQLVEQTTYYAGDNSGICGVRESIIVDFVVDPSGQNLDGIFCGNENPTIQLYIDDVLQPNIPLGGSVEVYTDLALTIQANNADAIPIGATNYYIVFLDNGGCKSQVEAGSTAVFDAPEDPTPSNPQEFCSDTNPTVNDLDPGTTSSFSWYENVDGLGEVIPPALSLSTPLIDGNTYYIQINDIFCISNAVPVTVTINDPVDPGTSATLEYCFDNIPTSNFNLFDELTGDPDTNGSWTGPLSTSNGHFGNVNISSLTTPGSYVFTYTVPPAGVCPEGSSTVTIIIHEVLTSGIPSVTNPASFCEASLPSDFDLFSLLDNEDPDGLWTQGIASTDPAVTSPIDLTGFIPGTYNFTYTQNVNPNPCPEESTTVQVIVLEDPNAGLAVNQIFCENDLVANSPFNLFDALDGSQDNNLGIWTDSVGSTASNPIDITGFDIDNSPYTFTYTIDNGTCIDTEDITITVEPAPESGNALSPVEICEEDLSANSPFDLFTLLDGTQDNNGTWYDGADTTGSVVTNPIDISGLSDGTFNYTYSVPLIGTCSDVDVTVQIIVNPQPNTGIPMSAIFCENNLSANSPLDLFGQLSGYDAGGTWTDDNASGALSGTNVDLTLLSIDSYNYTYSITDLNGCTNSSTVVVTVDPAPESGNALSPVEICEEDLSANSPFDLFTLLDGTQDNNGTWYEGTDTTGIVVTNPVDISSLLDGTYNYTYSVPVIGTCSDVDVTVQIIVKPQPNTGIPISAIFCENDLSANSPLDLFGQLSGYDAGGTWADDDSSGALTGSDIDLTLLTIGSYNYTYSISAVNGCTNSSTVIITVEDAPESGTANPAIEFCVSEIATDQTFNLFDLLEGEDQSGVWNDDTPSGALAGNMVTIDGLVTGTYDFTFDVNAIGTCDDVLVTVSIIIRDTPTPTAPANQSFCDAAAIGDLSGTGNNIQWYDEATGGTALDSSTALVDGENYFATQTDATTGCESSVRFEVTVVINQSPNSGLPNATPLVVCDNNNSVDLFTGLDGTQDTTGTWFDTDSSGALTGNTFDASLVIAGTYQFTYTVTGTPPCSDASTIVTVTVEETVFAGSDANLDVCSDNGNVDLLTLLGGADSGGSWSPELASGTNIFNPTADASDTYTYTISNSCSTDSSEIIITVTQAPNSGSDGTADLCIVNGIVDLTTYLGGTPDTNGTWTPVLVSGANDFDPNLDLAGVYTYTVLANSPCATDAVSQVTVTISDSPAPLVIDPIVELCLKDNPTVSDLDISVSGESIIWYEDDTSITPLDPTAILLDGDDYFATQTTSSGCESVIRVQVIVALNDPDTPTLEIGGNEFCVSDMASLLDLTENIVEFDTDTNNIVWYDDATAGSVLNISDLLNHDSTYYAALIDPITGCESSVRLPVTADLTSCGSLVIPDGFSPNGDGINDTYKVENLAFLYPNFNIEIYNRYGNVVYKGNASSQFFDGTSNQSRLVSKGDLPVGVYFYIVNFNDGTKSKQGRLYLSR